MSTLLYRFQNFVTPGKVRGAVLLAVAVIGLAGCQKSGGEKKTGEVAPPPSTTPDDSQRAKTCSWNGAEVADGAAVDAFQTGSVAFGSSCVSEKRTCRDGVLDGSLTFVACAVEPAANCSFSGLTVAHGQSVNAYAAATVPFGGTCAAQTRTCSNGTLSGTSTFAACTVQPAANCSFAGLTVAHGQSVNAYAAATVPFGGTCAAQTRTCSNGTLSGTSTFAACSVAAPAACTVQGQNVAHGGTISLYFSAHSNESGDCVSETRVCSNGSLSGSATELSCARPTLDDLFAGKAKFQELERAEELSFKFEKDLGGVNEQRLALFSVPKESARFGVVGGSPAADEQALYLVRSEDGREFQQLGGKLFEKADAQWVYRNPQVSVDTTADPVTYVMTLDCANREKGVESGSSVCVSTSTQPTEASTWSVPVPVVENDGNRSASSGVLLIEEGRKFLKWALVDDGKTAYLDDKGGVSPDDGDESTSSWAAELKSVLDDLGLVSAVGDLLFGAVADTHCKSPWDCNNVDVRDWRRIEKRYYALTLGSDYYRCARPEADAGDSNLWNVGLRRSDEVLGKYETLAEPLLRLPGKRACEVLAPTLGTGADEQFLYFTYAPSEKESHRLRARLIWAE